MRFISIAAILATSLLTSCSGHSGSNGTSALAKQLVGHWSTGGDDNLYFGALDPTTKIGSYILVHPDGKAFTHRYEIESENSGDRAINAHLLFASGDSGETKYVVSPDGKSMESISTITGIETHSQLTKVDDETAP